MKNVTPHSFQKITLTLVVGLQLFLSACAIVTYNERVEFNPAKESSRSIASTTNKVHLGKLVSEYYKELKLKF